MRDPQPGGREVASQYESRLETSDGQATLKVAGDIDLYAAPALKLDILAAIERSDADLVIDLTQVRFLDSTGLGVLVGALRRANEAGRSLELVVAAPPVLRVFTVTGLDRVFSITTRGAP